MAEAIEGLFASRPLARPRVMGILNVTPDSFYSGSRFLDLEEAVAQARRLVAEGAEILDIGGESTRPGSEPVGAQDEARRVLPLIARLSGLGVPLSIDTSKAEVARRALEAGASILNDVTALSGDPAMPEVAGRYPAVILMHMQGRPRTMQESPCYQDVVAELLAFFRGRLAAFEASGGEPRRVWIDPGIGFGKTLEHNLEIFRRLEEFQSLGRPIVLGASRKSFLGLLAPGRSPLAPCPGLGAAPAPPSGAPDLAAAPGAAPLPPEARLEGSLAAACRAAEAGVEVVRVHDPAATRRALEAFAAMRRGG
ncbi:MAG: dihydropteroate synthase [Elusimicrobia bacterium]|nr:dihydropteroate synthase [Elusimicrobiota bacterium]